MKRAVIGAAAMAVVMCGVAAPQAQTGKPATNQPNQAADKGKDTNAGAVSRLSQALELVSVARQDESPAAMLAAAQMLRGVRVQDGKQRVGTKATEQAGTGPEGRKGQTAAPTVDITALLNEAKPWAKGNASMLALLDAEIARPAARGGTLGSTGNPIRHVDRVLARRTDVYSITFRGGEMAEVAVIGDGDTDLDLYIEDEFGNVVVRDTDYSDRMLVQWTPRWTGVYKVKIRNLGTVYNEYTLFTN
jgi:hypothetical protein